MAQHGDGHAFEDQPISNCIFMCIVGSGNIVLLDNPQQLRNGLKDINFEMLYMNTIIPKSRSSK